MEGENARQVAQIGFGRGHLVEGILFRMFKVCLREG